MHLDTRDQGPGFVASLLDLLRRRWRVGAGVFATVFGLAAALVLLSRPVYRADSRLRLGEPPPMGGVSPNASIFGFFQLGGDPFSNDLELLASRTLAEGVVRDAALNASVRAPRGWHRDSLFHAFSTTGESSRETFAVRWTPRGTVRVRRTEPADSPVAEVTPGTRLVFGGVQLTPRAWRDGMPREVEVRTVPSGEAVRRTRERLGVERARREANVVEISYDDPDPAVAREVVASTVERFVELRTALQRRESDQTVDSLRVVANQTLAELGVAERAVEDLQRSARLIAPDAQSEAFIERYSEAVGELEGTRAEFAAVSRALERAGSATDPAAAWTDLAAYPAFLQNTTIGELLGSLSALEERRTELASRRNETNREMRVLLEQIRQRDASLRSLAHGYRSALGERIGLLEAQVSDMDRALAAVPAQTMELGRRHRDVRILSEVLVLTEQRLRQEELRQALTFSNVQVIDPPALQFRPVWPRKKLGLGIGFLLASAFGLLAMVVAERADPPVRRGAEVARLIGAPVLAVAKRNGNTAITLSARDIHAVLRGRGGTAANGRHLVLAPVGAGAAADEIAAALRAGGAPDGNGGAPPTIFVAPRPDDYPDPADGEAAPVVLTLACDAAGRAELQQAAERLRERGGEILGAILVRGGTRRAGRVWR